MIPINPTLAEARSLLSGRYMALMVEALNESIGEVRKLTPPISLALNDSARAHVINCTWYELVTTGAIGLPGVVRGNNQNQEFFVIEEAVLVRHKLFDNNLTARNYPTRRAMRWVYPYPLEGIPPIGRVQLGYRLDPTGILLRDAFLVLPYGDRNLWVWQVWGVEIDTFGLTLPLERRSIQRDEIFAYDDYSQAV